MDNDVFCYTCNKGILVVTGVTTKIPKKVFTASPYETHYFCKRCHIWIEKSAVEIRVRK